MKRFEWTIHIVIFCLQMGGFVPGLFRVGTDTLMVGATNTLNTMTTATILAIVTIFLLTHARLSARYLSALWLLIALLVLAFASLIWSDYPDVTIRRSVSLTTSFLWAWYVAARYSLRELVSLTMQSIGLLAATSIGVAIVAPGIGMSDPIGPAGWRGVFTNKNQLGVVMAVGTVTFCYGLMSGRERRGSLVFCALGFLLCATLLFLSQSRTSWIVGLLGPAICLMNRSMHRRVGVGIIIWTTLLLIFAPAVVLLGNELPTIALWLGRDATLSGRVDLWQILPSFIEERPWLGYGFGAFWVETSPNVDLIWNATGWQPPSAHNGWLDVLLELGIIGWALTVLQVLLILINAVRAVIDGRDPDAQYPLLMIFLLLIVNLAESALVRPANFIWITLVISAVALAKIGKQRRSQAQPIGAGRFRDRERFKLQRPAMTHR